MAINVTVTMTMPMTMPMTVIATKHKHHDNIHNTGPSYNLPYSET
eukprot:CAMPEP_0185916936 /NCGR_PEP_ID=MMETSP0924C-20121207/4015_1 /TAXON_ID=321610 /ORGANISM="Perkinsus chesapeaki, Strain ATCC PRA-65" /LENGTH=44 /DNA_ID= /DNA_START= /DNA_END= /DNA_ORIENTATION=